MSLRELVGPDGALWRVWDVHPSIMAEDEVVNHERRRNHAPEPMLERRTAPPVTPGMEHGWLAFESPRGKRRLHPIPPGWESCSDDELRALWERAGNAEKD